MDFVGKRRIWFIISTLLIVLGVGTMIVNGTSRGRIMNFGVDFTGGTLLTLRFQRPVTVHEVREVLAKYDLEQSVIQKTGKNDISIRCEPLDNEVRVKIIEDLKGSLGGGELLEADVIGPVIGRELRTQAIWALIVASIGIIVYVSFRFEFNYAVAAVIALYHDAIITTGIISLLWREVNTPFVAAILTIMGYSINDTIVIFDRIRENIKRLGAAKKNFAEIVNISISQTLTRSINTVLTTMFMVICLLLFGGSTIKDFALVLLIGFLCGTYSSIFVASPLLTLFKRRQKKLS